MAGRARPLDEMLDEMDDEQEAAKPDRPAKRGRARAAGAKAPAAARAAAPAEPETNDEPTGNAPEVIDEQPTVRAADAAHGKRVGLYLHPEDYRLLGLRKLDDGADFNARIRAMIAVYRTNARFRAQVDRVARTAPRGPYSSRQ